MEDSLFTARIERVKRAASGGWPRLFEAAGIDPSHLAKQNRPCPLCGGTDRFSYFAKEDDGHWFCRHCGAGDGIKLVQKYRHTGFIETLRWLETELGIPAPQARDEERRAARERAAAYRAEREKEEEEARRRKAELEALWDSAKPLTREDSPPLRYLAKRGLAGCDLSHELRWVEALPYKDQDGNDSTWPALLARVSDERGGLVSIHRTYLTEEGDKAPVPVAKKLAAGPLGNGFIRLFPPSDFLCLAEGIETALSVHELTGLPAWSVISLNGFQRFEAPPEGVRVLCIYGDNDASFTGAAGAYALAARLRARHPELQVDVRIPEGTGTDWNDVIRASRAAS